MNAQREDELKIVDDLSQSARVSRRSVLLPAGDLTEEHLNAVRAAFKSYLNERQIRISRAVLTLPLSDTVVREFMSGRYKGRNERVARAINTWIELDGKKVEKQGISYVQTKVAEEIRTIAELAIAEGAMAAIVAPSGSGKTKLLEVLAEKHRGWLITANQDHRPKAFLVALGLLVGVPSPSRMGNAALIATLAQRLKNSMRPIFIDEAQLLPENVLGRIRSIHDAAGVTFIMVGSQAILEAVNDRNDGGQFASRTIQYSTWDHFCTVEHPSGARASRPLFTKEEIKAFLVDTKVRFDPDAFELVWAVACLPNHGCLRTVRRLVRVLRPGGVNTGKAIARKEVMAALGALFGMVGEVVFSNAKRHIELEQMKGVA